MRSTERLCGGRTCLLPPGEQPAAHLGPLPTFPRFSGTRIISSPAFCRGTGLADVELSLECV